MRRLTYAVKEAFLTLQGEGTHAGARAVFVRFAGCNVWTGRDEHRGRDVAKGCCAAWCDTDFVGVDGENGGQYGATVLAQLVRRLWGARDGEALAVITGGEPSLQLDEALVDALHAERVRVHVETNGSGKLPASVDWITLSPKPPMQVIAQRYDEVKVVVPDIEPATFAHHASVRFVQPRDDKDEAVNRANLECAIAHVLEHPVQQWRLSIQSHKIAGLP